MSVMRKKGKKAAIYGVIQANIKKYRKAAEMGQLELGKALNFPDEYAQQRISQYETGVRSPSPETLEEIAKVLNKPFVSFYFADYEGLVESGKITPPVDKLIDGLLKKILEMKKEEVA